MTKTTKKGNKTRDLPEEPAEEKKVAPQEQLQQAAAQAIQSYFTKEINDAVHEMTNDRMFSLLRELEQSEYWHAILRYNNLRLLSAQSALNTLDPVTYPSAISKQQGAMMGVCDLQNAIITMVEAEKAAREEMNAINEDL